MSSTNGQRAKPAKIGPKLDGGVIFTTTSDETVYLLVGCLHSVFTLMGGFLVTIDFHTPKSCRIFASQLSADLGGPEPPFQDYIFRSLFVSIGLALSYSQVLEGIKAWIDAIKRIREWVAGIPAWAKEALKVWDEFLATLEGKKARCSCSEQTPDETFRVHLKKAHWRGKGLKAVKRKA